MNSRSSRNDVYKKFPKVELHRHLEGSLRLSTLKDIARQFTDDGLPSLKDISALVQVQEGDDLSDTNFLSKFLTLRYFYLSPDIIRRISYEAVADAAEDGCVYMELRFTPTTLARIRDFSLGEVMDWVIAGIQKADKEYGTKTRLIVSMNRHDSVELAENIVELCVDRISKGIVALDLAGNEAEFPVAPFSGILRDAKANGLSITIHAGEWGGSENVRRALEDMETPRIGHGVRILEDPAVVGLARERGAVFEVCPTSNYQSGVVSTLDSHPLVEMVEEGLNATINTDNPGIQRVTLSDEYRLSCETLGMSKTMLSERVIAAAEGSFLPPSERQQLLQSLHQKLAEVA